MTERLRNTLNVLAQMAHVDGELDPRELSFIYGVGIRNGVDVDTIGDIIATPNPVINVDDLSINDKVDLLSDVIRVMMVDGRVLPREIAFSLEIADHLGIASAAVTAFIEEIAIYPAVDEQLINARLTQAVQ